MPVCKKCNKQKDEELFKNKNKPKLYATCFQCRETSRIWRLANKERVSKYNKCFNADKKNGKSIQIVLGKHKDDKEWTKYNSQLEASKKLGLYTSNINKVIKGSLNTTGGYVFKLHTDVYKSTEKTWNEIKVNNEYGNKCIGAPARHRVLHETINNEIGKVCCSCKEWKSLNTYNASTSHWDNLRNDCKQCLINYRKLNRRQIQNTMNKYEKVRKQIDPGFKLSKTLRSRVGSALKAMKTSKHMNTMKLTGCDIKYLKKHLETLFEPNMTWKNHGKWHIDHIIPCSSFDLTDKVQQQMCFNWRNLQPMWQIDNLEKSGKFDQASKDIFCNLMTKVLADAEANNTTDTTADLTTAELSESSDTPKTIDISPSLDQLLEYT
jgi:hypothetical protein